MIVHVAEAGEARGRVVLRCGFSPAANDAGLKAAIHVARAYHAEIEALFVENRHVFALASYPFARELALAGGAVDTLSPGNLDARYRALHDAEGRRVLAGAAEAGIEARVSTMREDDMAALARCCTESGPWNVVVLADPAEAASGNAIGRVLESVLDATGVIAAARRSAPGIAPGRGPVVIAAEDEERLPVMLRAAERLAAVNGSEIRLMLVAGEEDILWLEAQARLLVAGNKRCTIEMIDASRIAAAALVQRLWAMRAGFLIARHGGLLLPPDEPQTLVSVLRCPVFCIR